MKLTSLLFMIGFMSVPVFGKITFFSSADAMRHILSSKIIADKQSNGQELYGLDFAKASVTASGPKGIGEQFDVSFQYTALRGSIIAICNFTATVKNVASKFTTLPPGVEATEPSEVKLSKIVCAN